MSSGSVRYQLIVFTHVELGCVSLAGCVGWKVLMSSRGK